MKTKVACSTYCYNKFSFDRALEGISSVGLRYVELGSVPGRCEHVMPERMNDLEIRKLVKKISQYRLQVISISGHCDLTAREGVSLFKRRVDLATELGVGIVNTGTGHVETEEEEERFFENMQQLISYVSPRKITIALETHGGITSTGANCRKTIERINSEFVRINYDPANVIYYMGKRPEDDLRDIVDYVAHFHIKDKLGGKGVQNFPAVGRGIIDFSILFKILRDASYSGPLSFEIEFTKEGPKTAAQVDEALKNSVEFINGIIRNIDT